MRCCVSVFSPGTVAQRCIPRTRSRATILHTCYRGQKSGGHTPRHDSCGSSSGYYMLLSLVVCTICQNPHSFTTNISARVAHACSQQRKPELASKEVLLEKKPGDNSFEPLRRAWLAFQAIWSVASNLDSRPHKNEPLKVNTFLRFYVVQAAVSWYRCIRTAWLPSHALWSTTVSENNRPDRKRPLKSQQVFAFFLVQAAVIQ